MSEMKQYIGTKKDLLWGAGREVKAKPMTLGQYNSLRGWEMPPEENPNSEGYLVEYLDSPNKNHPDYENYISWSPKDVFERSYRLNGTFLERLIIEEQELGAKITGLNKGLNSDGFAEKVGAYQFELLCLQHSTMIAYRRVLNMRIKDLNEKVATA